MLSEDIFSIQNQVDFDKVALRVFDYQYTHIPVYQRFCNLLGVAKSSVTALNDIPFLPIAFFKSHTVIKPEVLTQQVFSSSGTTGSVVSKHHVRDVSLYERSFTKGFNYFYGAIKEYTVLALLPSYLERSGSSLVYMAQHFITQSEDPDSGFYLHNLDALIKKLVALQKAHKKVLLIGVSFALLDLVEKQTFNLGDTTIIMETGGMKGKRKELIREELHDTLKKGFGVEKIHSEYGMTELLSQAYSLGDGLFNCPPWMRISTRDPEDALTLLNVGKSGGINVIDLANLHSCSFIATQDLGKLYPNNSFEILGRFDHSDIRGCNLMVL
ncbi:LuxE/PaaK family acyltransferase [Aquimarina intermedia]|uniref:Acyl-protein synthetase LuxE n=1 Tax=Aquimarina intermedia TaxID=350814 RepID=A0A5S5CF82_9FLAO|nr:acyl transferase [Aquimarina intermedia]TYP77172.1 acyl-protein synthetase LuxE [Aquimarina intermedia]